jgi:hypothetical protein
MSRILNGLVAGFAATVVTAIVLIVGKRTELLAWFDPVTELTTLANKYRFGPVPPEIGWAMLFVVGTVVLGILYALVRNLLPRGPVTAGLIFGALVWSVEVVVVQPLIGVGLLTKGVPAGLNEGLDALLLNLVFGVALGLFYANLRSSAAVKDVIAG